MREFHSEKALEDCLCNEWQALQRDVVRDSPRTVHYHPLPVATPVGDWERVATLGPLRQVTLPGGGIPDLLEVAFLRESSAPHRPAFAFRVTEIKNRELVTSDLDQLTRYMASIDGALGEMRDSEDWQRWNPWPGSLNLQELHNDHPLNSHITGLLIGMSASDGIERLSAHLNDITVATVSCDTSQPLRLYDCRMGGMMAGYCLFEQGDLSPERVGRLMLRAAE